MRRQQSVLPRLNILQMNPIGAINLMRTALGVEAGAENLGLQSVAEVRYERWQAYLPRPIVSD